MSKDFDRLLGSRDSITESFEMGFHDVFREIGLQLKIVRKDGAFCADVEAGLEVAALINLGISPRNIVASEPVIESTFVERNKVEPSITKTLRGLERRGVRVIRDCSREAMMEVERTRPGLKFGLVTYLNVFPELQGVENIEDFIVRASKFVAPGGCVLVSACEDDFFTADRFEKAADKSRTRLPNWEIRNINRMRSVVGSVFLAARNPK